MKALVTGASGFIGGHVITRLLARGHEVHALVRPTSRLEGFDPARVTLHQGDVTDAVAVAAAMHGMEVVFHFAALIKARDDAQYEAVNMGGTRHVVAALAGAAPGARLVYCSSLAAGGPMQKGRPISANDRPQPISAYGRTKLAGETLIRAAMGEFGWTILRPPPVYGPRDRDVFLLFKTLKRGLMPYPGTGAQPLPMVHVEDLAHATVLAGERTAADGGPPPGRIYYVTDGDLRTFRGVLETIAKVLEVRPLRVGTPVAVMEVLGVLSQAWGRVTGQAVLLTPDKIAEVKAAGWACDDAPVRHELGYKERYRLEAGLRQTAEWYRSKGWL